MAEKGLDLDQFPEVAAGQGLDLDAFPEAAPGMAAQVPAAGLDLDAFPTNPNLDMDDKITPKVYFRNVLETMSSGVEPLGRWYSNMAKGGAARLGSGLGGLGTATDIDIPGIRPFVSVPFKTLGAKLAQFGEMKDDPKGSWLTEDLPHGMGGALTYLGVGLASGGTGAVGYGMLDMGQQMYEDAKAHGATEEDARLSFLAGEALGATEAIPVAHALKRLNTLSEGNFYEIAKGLSGASAIKEAMKGFVLGGSVEAGQQVVQNWIASDLIGYDPERTLGENAAANFYTGGAIGSIFLGVTGSLERSARDDARRKLEEQRQGALASGDPINEIAGKFSPTADLQEMQVESLAIAEDLQARGKEYMEARNRGEMKTPGSFVPTERQGIDYVGADVQTKGDGGFFLDVIAPTSIDTTVEKGLVPKGEMMTAEEALRKTPVVALEVAPYKEELRVVEVQLNALKAQAPSGVMTTETKRLGTIEMLEGTKKILQKKTNLAKLYVRHMKDYAAKFNQALGGDSVRIVVGDFTGRRESQNGAHGIMRLLRNAMQVEGKMTDVLQIDVDFDALATLRYNEEMARRPWYSTPETKQQRQSFFETLNHELGHMVVSKHLGDTLKQAFHGDSGAMEIYAAVEADYARWLQKQKDGQFYHYVENVGTPNYQGIPEGASKGNMYVSDLPFEHRKYLFSFDEYFAQQMARMATQGKLVKEGVLTKFFKPVLEQYQKIFEELPHYAKSEYNGNFEKFIRRLSLQHQISEEIQRAVAGGPKSLIDALKGISGFNKEMFAGVQEHLDKWNKMMEYGQNLLQIHEQNSHIDGLRDYVLFTRAWAALSRKIDAMATETITDWRKLGKKKMGVVADLLFEETSKGKRLDGAELAKRLPDLDAQKVYAQIRQDFDYVLAQMEGIELEQINKNFPDNELKRSTELQAARQRYEKMRTGGYFPYMRFGKWIVTVRANGKQEIDGVEYEDKEVVSFESYESRFDRDRAVRAMQGKDARVLINPSVMSEARFAVQGLPAAMLRAMKERIPNLDVKQKEAIDEALQDLAPFKGLRKQFLRRRGTAGFSEDAMRSYAQYMRMAAGHISRVKYAEDFVASISKVEKDVQVLSVLGKDSTKRQEIANWMKEHNDYIMNPVNEWTGLRGAVFQWFLGFNIKSAVINLSQVPMITLPYLSARYGDLAAARELATANIAAVSYWKNRKKWTEAKPDSSRGRIVRLLEQGKKDGWLDQALATELAIAASEGTVERSLPVNSAKRAWYKASEWGAKPFAVAEKMNRTVTAIAAYNLEYARIKDHRTAYNAAWAAVDKTQYENARWNRPAFMRGKMGSAFIFFNYIQNTLYFSLGGDKGGVRSLVMFMLMGGLMALPFAENIEDLVDSLGTKFKEWTGQKNPKMDLRREMMEAIEELNMNPDLVLHGLGRSSFGMPALGQMVGLPLPEFDVSGSLSMGRPLPLTGMLADGRTRDTSGQILGSAAVEMGGAGAAMFDSLLQGIVSNDPDTWKRTEKMLPTWMKNASKAARLAARGEEKTARGDIVAEFDPHDPQDFLTLVGQGLGFTPTKLSEGWERTMAEREGVNYYTLRREGLLKTHNWAVMQGGAQGDEARDARQAIKEYNEVVPFPELKIGGETIKDSFDSYIKSQKMNEMGIGSEKRLIRLRQSIAEAYTPSDIEGSGTADQ